MRNAVTVILITMQALVFSQAKKSRNKPPVKNCISLQEYFAGNKLCPDSALTPYLYYQVYDWLGTRYKYSGDTKNGVDCSGFVNKMYENAYCITLNGGSKDIWKAVCPVEKSDLKEGDILFFKIKKGQISHVGIYLGNNKFAHASVKKGVIVSDLDDEYYKKRFYMGGRIEMAEELRK